MTYNVFSGTLNPTHSLTPGGGVPWDDLREIVSACQWVAKVPNAVEILRKI